MNKIQYDRNETISVTEFRNVIRESFDKVANGTPVLIRRAGLKFVLVLEKDLK